MEPVLRAYKKFSLGMFGRFGDISGFKKIEPDLKASQMHVPLRTYASMVISTAVLAYIAALAVTLTMFIFVPLDFVSIILFTLTIPIFAAFGTFAFLYFYPRQKAASTKKSIENDLPFALAHLSAIASSGIQPEYMFELLTEFDEYRDIAKQASLIVRYVKIMGMSSTTAIRTVAEKSPSPVFKQILNGITFNIEKGGDLVEYLREMSDKAMFNYRIKREKYLKTLSTYADIYTALLIAAPLMMLAVLGIIGIIGGEVLGLTIPELIMYLTFVVLPGMNISFLLFIHLTYPGV